jgi:heme a synthase
LKRYWFISSKGQQIPWLALTTFVLAFVVILLGAYTRLTDAGLSCPDWPHCYGFLTAPYKPQQVLEASKIYPSMPIDSKKAWTEMIHRYFAGTVGILVLMLSGSLLFNKKLPAALSKLIAFALVGLIAIQVLLGMLTVTIKLKPIIVTAHLATGLSLLTMLWWLCLLLSRRKATPFNNDYRLLPWLWLGLLIIIGQILLGGWVSSHYAGLACIDFPYCNGQLFPNLKLTAINSDLITIHMLHRLGALSTAIYVSVLAIYLLLTKPSYRTLACILLLLLCLQISLGILNIYWLRPVWLALSHLAVGIGLLLTLVFALVKAYFGTQGLSYGPRYT